MLSGCRFSHHYCNNPRIQLHLVVQLSSSFNVRPAARIRPSHRKFRLLLNRNKVPSARSSLNLSASSSIIGSSNSSSSSSSSDMGGAYLQEQEPACKDSSDNTQQNPVLSDCLSQREDYQEPPSEGLSPVAGGIVALGKFDALHIGHRELAIQAAKVGVPYLLSFIGMAEVLGWEPRPPIVAKCDRKRILSSWAPYCCSIAPKEFQVEFSKVRALNPSQFVQKLAKELGVRGVVAGENYRFGYKAAGDASDLVRLCQEHGMSAYIISSVMDRKQDPIDAETRELKKEQGQVSSTRVRLALSKGDMKYVSELLGRHHRLMFTVDDQEKLLSDRNRLSAPKSCLLNLPPCEGRYENCSLVVGDDDFVPCKVIIDSTHIHMESGDVANWTHRFQLFGIDFGEPGL